MPLTLDIRMNFHVLCLAESHNGTTLRKFSVHGNTVVYDDPPATPAKNKEIPSEQMNVQSSHSGLILYLNPSHQECCISYILYNYRPSFYTECDDKDTPQFNPHGCLPSIHVLTPIAQTSFDVTGSSGNIGECVIPPAYMHTLVAVAEVLPYPLSALLSHVTCMKTPGEK